MEMKHTFFTGEGFSAGELMLKKVLDSHQEWRPKVSYNGSLSRGLEKSGIRFLTAAHIDDKGAVVPEARVLEIGEEQAVEFGALLTKLSATDPSYQTRFSIVSKLSPLISTK